MSINVSAFGAKINLVASNTFPVGLTITQFPDDMSPFEAPELEIAAAAMGINGDLVTYAKPAPIPYNLSLIPLSEEDVTMQIIAQANRVSKSFSGINDVFTMIVSLPNGSIYTYTGGVLVKTMIGQTGETSGRLKSHTYSFVFENVIGG